MQLCKTVTILAELAEFEAAGFGFAGLFTFID
jgi:hypothetical protein